MKNINRLCHVGGGRWKMKAWDGHKYLCLDDFEANKPCLIYSFGLSTEWSFEIDMARFGKQQDISVTWNVSFLKDNRYGTSWWQSIYNLTELIIMWQNMLIYPHNKSYFYRLWGLWVRPDVEGHDEPKQSLPYTEARCQCQQQRQKLQDFQDFLTGKWACRCKD